jgi:hypothetical protein
MRSSEQGLLTKLGFRDADREDLRHDKACRFFTRPDIAEKLLKVIHPPSRVWSGMWRYAPPEPDGLWMTWSADNGVTENVVRTQSGFHIGFIDAVVMGSYSLFAPEIAEGSSDDVYWAGDTIPPRLADAAKAVVMEIKTSKWSETAETVKKIARLGVDVRAAVARLTRNPASLGQIRDLASWKSCVERATCSGPSNLDDWKVLAQSAIQEIGIVRHGLQKCGSVRLNIEVKINRTPTSDIIRQIETYRGGNTSYYGYDSVQWVLAVDYALSEEERRALLAQYITPIRLGPTFEAYLRETDNAADVVTL